MVKSIIFLMQELTKHKGNFYFWLLIISGAALTVAYIAEYITDLYPCPLCVYQRFSYLIFIFLAIIALANNKSCQGKSYNKINYYTLITLLCALIIAGYHVGIERKLWQMSPICSPATKLVNQNLLDLSINEFKNLLYSDKIRSLCDKPAFLFGLPISMTEMNFLLNFLLLIIIITLIKIKNI